MILTSFEVFIEASVNNWIEGAVGKCYVASKEVEFSIPSWQLKIWKRNLCMILYNICQRFVQYWPNCRHRRHKENVSLAVVHRSDSM